MPLEKEYDFNAPIPGQSLTGELGSKPWEQPPKYNTVEEAIEHYMTGLEEPEMQDGVSDAIEMEFPLTSIADITTKAGVMNGLHSIDVAIQVAPVLVEFMISMAEEADIPYEVGPKKQEAPRKGSLQLAAKDLFADVQEEEIIIEEVVEEPKGFLPKRGEV